MSFRPTPLAGKVLASIRAAVSTAAGKVRAAAAARKSAQAAPAPETTVGSAANVPEAKTENEDFWPATPASLDPEEGEATLVRKRPTWQNEYLAG